MKFENIAPGDVVLAPIKVTVGWNSYKSFLISLRVERVTPKQFRVNGNQYRKSDGSSVIGGRIERVLTLGEKMLNNQIAADQSEERKNLILRIRKANEIKSIITQFKIEHEHPKLHEIHKQLKDIEKMLIEL